MTRVPGVMLQGTGSHVGKTTLVAGLCRLFARRGLRVRPFKPQNMSNNAAATADGGEIGRAQALQARAAGVMPSVHMNPVLLKPESETGSQVIVQGKRWKTLRAADYARRKTKLMPRVLESLAVLEEDADLVLVEGAGSPAEINLRAGDIANMGFAAAAGMPVVLVGDIERGGVIASLVGTKAVLGESDAALVRGFVVNKFRGDPRLFDGGQAMIEERTGWACLGVVPWLTAANDLPAEDVLGLARADEATETSAGEIVVAVPLLPRIANFDDLDPLRMEPGVRIVPVRPGEAVPAETRLVVLPGSKSTIADLRFLREQGWDVDIKAHVRRGGAVLGLCGGYQMLGRRILDPAGVEGGGEAEGLGLLDVETVLMAEKITSPTSAVHVASGEAVHAYEIHLGRSFGADCERPMFMVGGRREGASSADGRVAGSYLHGLLAADGFRRAFLASLGAVEAAGLGYEARIDAVLDALADHLERHLDVEQVLRIARSR
ncbi:MAG: cobyric acid synthase [Bauldia sp.]|nr:cobyric acid synthase [Bauldia sp.]